jgi:hypothetical protein
MPSLLSRLYPCKLTQMQCSLPSKCCSLKQSSAPTTGRQHRDTLLPSTIDGCSLSLSEADTSRWTTALYQVFPSFDHTSHARSASARVATDWLGCCQSGIEILPRLRAMEDFLLPFESGQSLMIPSRALSRTVKCITESA